MNSTTKIQKFERRHSSLSLACTCYRNIRTREGNVITFAEKCFLRTTKEEENCAAILTGAKVLEPAAFRSSGGDDDVYMCEYSYDQNFSRFRRRTEWEDSDFSEDEFDAEAKNILWSETESSDDDEDYDNQKEKRKAEKRAHVRQTKADIAASKLQHLKKELTLRQNGKKPLAWVNLASWP